MLLPLPPQQLRIARMVVAGKMNKEIAYEMGLTEGTVKGYLYVIFKKLRVRNRAELAVFMADLPKHLKGDE
jgi:DNA-binding NarL/FixJ family response regulator